MTIGDWVRRKGLKWHLVESIIDGDAITKCGRRLEHSNSDRYETSGDMPLTRMVGQPQDCKLCAR